MHNTANHYLYKKINFLGDKYGLKPVETIGKNVKNTFLEDLSFFVFFTMELNYIKNFDKTIDYD